MGEDDNHGYARADRLIAGIALAGAVGVVAVFAADVLWLQPRKDSGTLSGWPMVAQQALLGVAHLVAFGLPAAPRLRILITMFALAAWGLIPVWMRSYARVSGDGSPWLPVAGGAVLAAAVTVLALRAWRRTLVLTPGGLVVTEIADGRFEIPWDRADEDWVTARPDLRGVDAAFLARVLDHYRANPGQRAAIGTPVEYARLVAQLRTA
ncbi:hypothetical protein ABZS66_51575 [Dactylosporangium sp. NPDC005572]|uniref:hypothetical protein n=1 Tax=Dactylosporangium sp. NPDC005572 TaxID=3156889 RepID=UPI0033A7AA5D